MADEALHKILSTIRLLHEENQEIRASAQRDIEVWQKTPGFCMMLNNLLYSVLNDMEALKITVSVYKMTLDRYWGGYDGYIIQDSEKDQLRVKLVESLLQLDHPMVSEHFLSILGGIAARDFPERWPTLYTDAITCIQNAEPKVRVKGMRLIHHCLKAMLSVDTIKSPEDHKRRKLQREKLSQRDQASGIFGVVVPLWLEAANVHLNQLSNYLTGQPHDNALIILSGTQCNVGVKIVQLLLSRFLDVFVMENVEATNNFFGALLKTLNLYVESTFMQQRVKFPTHNKNFLKDTLIRMLRLVTSTQANNPLRFVPYLESFLEFYMREFLKHSFAPQRDRFHDKYYIQILTFIADILSTAEYNLRADIANSDTPVVASTVRKFFNGHTVIDILKATVSSYMKLSQDALELWKSDPEELILTELSDAYQDVLLPCAEFFWYWFLEINKESFPQIGQFITNFIADLDNSQDTSEPVVLLKESFYHAFVLCSRLEPKHVAFRRFCTAHVEKHFRGQHILVKRRIVEIPGAWNRAIVKGKMVLLHGWTEKDIVTRLAAALSLSSLLDHFDFECPIFYKYLPMCIPYVIALAHDMDGGSTTVQVLDIINLVINKTNEQIRPQANEIIKCCRQLWDASNGKKLVQGGIAKILGTLVAALVGSPLEFEKELVFFLDEILDVKKNKYLSVLDEGLVLWWYMIHQAPFLSPVIESFFPQLYQLLEGNMGDSDLFQSGIQVLTAYTLIGKQPFFAKHSSTIVKIINLCIQNPTKNGIIVAATEYLKITFRMFFGEIPRFQESLVELFILFVSPRCPMAKYVDDRSAAPTAAALFFELLVTNQSLFFELMNLIQTRAANTNYGIPYNEGNPMIWFFRAVLDKINPDQFVVFYNEQITAVGLMMLLESTDPAIICRTRDIVTKCIAFLIDISAKKADREKLHQYKPKNTMVYGSPGYRLLADIHENHISAKADITSCFQQEIQKCAQIHGKEWLQELQQTLRPDLYSLLCHSEPVREDK